MKFYWQLLNTTTLGNAIIAGLKMKRSTNRRSSAKYPALKKELNIKTRHDYIEPDYINGVVDSEGNKVIRALTHEEKEWLNKFYEEYIITNFKKDGTDLIDDIEDRRTAYRENNHRNVCLFNQKNRMGLLDQYDGGNFEKTVMNRINGIDFEMALINELDYKVEDLEEYLEALTAMYKRTVTLNHKKAYKKQIKEVAARIAAMKKV
jgi:hypothetical protein